ncbi:MAG: ATP-dependent DNA helicase RecG [Candidatus Omnitrophica bacterium]|nr:ATP-dependent DNA helicase RecG [Candidatus Omnitrophota bacterium]
MIKSNPREVKTRPPQCPPQAVNLETSVQYLKGVGPRRSALFRRLGIKTLRDLLYHFPRRHEDRRSFLPIARLVEGQKSTVRGRVSGSSLFRAKTGTVILQVVVRDATGVLLALWFNQPYMRRWFKPGQEIILYGLPQRSGRRLQMLVPEFELVSEETEAAGASLHMGRIVPIYPATSGLNQRELRSAAAAALKLVKPALADPLPEALRLAHHLPGLPTALVQIHFPKDLESASLAMERLAFDELLCFQLALAMRRRALSARPGIAHRTQGELVKRWKESLPFELTAGQRKAIEEITADMASPTPMNRLLQGEVGSGKTVVAAYAIAAALEGGFQAAVMAPTEVLARQHAMNLSQLFFGIDASVALLTSGIDPASRRALLSELKAGEVQVLVGTHALLTPEVSWAKLGLVVVDEQQKFGVDQRKTLTAKGTNPDLLILTATPIPRTLALTLYGELAISTIAERPEGRTTARTLWMDETRRPEVYGFIRSELAAGRQAFVVCPRIEAEAASAKGMFEEYQRIFTGCRIGLLHGRMLPQERRAVFAAFQKGEIQILVATQIIEVGVDLPNATVMVIEGAERFGLSQLHQLRGRVGRGRHLSTCILLGNPKGPEAAQRLKTLEEATDAFQIAEEDLKLRGPGELLGKRQSGIPDLKCLAWASHGPWLERSREEAQRLLDLDPEMAQAGVQGLRREVFVRFPQLTAPAVSS